MQNSTGTKGKLVVVSGFSGAGKGTVMKAIIDTYDNYALSISATSRKPREGEEEGREYFFKTREEFEKMIADNMLVEYAEYVGNYYGTPREYVEQKLAEGKNVILEIEIQGAMKIKKQYPEALLIFMTPPSGEELIRRLKGRGTEDNATIMSRMRRAIEEAEGVGSYDYTLINDEVDKCAERLHNIVTDDTKTYNKDVDLINNIKAELAQIVEGE
ncbi:MAG: guanylate kinase [Lachnospiraceae bacterium]|nr:guanylate kinase [Lachnospiraceae bacterium]